MSETEIKQSRVELYNQIIAILAKENHPYVKAEDLLELMQGDGRSVLVMTLIITACENVSQVALAQFLSYRAKEMITMTKLSKELLTVEIE